MKKIALAAIVLSSLVGAATASAQWWYPRPTIACNAGNAGQTYNLRHRNDVLVYSCDGSSWELQGVCSNSTGQCVWQ